jgi:uncharacterized delta-60 repeat protein
MFAATSTKTKQSARNRFIRLLLEPLEDRFVLNGAVPPSALATITSLNINPQQEMILPDGKILIGLSAAVSQNIPVVFTSGAPSSQIAGIVSGNGAAAIELIRLNPDGTLDQTFGVGGVSLIQPNLSDSFSSFAIEPDGKIIVAAYELNSGKGYTVPTGLDWPSYSFNAGKPEYDFVWQDSGLGLINVNADGTVDSSFSAGTIPGFQLDSMSVDGTLGGVTVQPDGKILVTGEAEGLGNSTIFVARYNTDGTLDASFNANGSTPGVATTSLSNGPTQFYAYGYGMISAIAVDGAGHVVVAGDQSAGLDVFRFNADGSVDKSFGTNGVVNCSAGPDMNEFFTSMAIQSDGKLVLEAWLAPTFGGSDSPYSTNGLDLIRLNQDGSYDTSFGNQGVVQFATATNPVGPFSIYRPELPTQGPLGPVEAGMTWIGGSNLLIQSDGKIVVAGELMAGLPAQDAMQGVVARFNADGTLDTSFGEDGIQTTTILATQSTYLAVDPQEIGTAPDGSLLVIGTLDYGSYIPIQVNPNLVPYVTLLDFENGAPDGGGAPPTGSSAPITAGALAAQSPNATALADAIFQQFNTQGILPVSLPLGGYGSDGLNAPPIASPTPPAALPVPGQSDTAAVTKLSGGGLDTTTTTDDPISLSGEPEPIWNLALASDSGSAV